MAEGAFADIRSIIDLENGIRTFGSRMADADSQIEHAINLYFENFERGLRVLEERLRRAEEDLVRAEIALERQRDKRVWVEDEDGDGHWEPADCSAEEARVARCMAVRDRCLRDVNSCRQMISDARTKRYVHKEKLSMFHNKSSEAIEKIGLAKETVEKHRSLGVPPSMNSSHGFYGSSSSTSTSSMSRGESLSRPRPPMNTRPSFGPAPTPSVERPRSPQNERINPTPSRLMTEADRPRGPFNDRINPTPSRPMTEADRPRGPLNDRINQAPNRPVTEADRPRSPFGSGGLDSKYKTSSFWDDIKKINEDYQNEDSNE